MRDRVRESQLGQHRRPIERNPSGQGNDVKLRYGAQRKTKAGRPRFGSVTVWGWNGSSGSGFRFRRFLCKKGFSVFQYCLTGKDGSGPGFGSWKMVPAVPVLLSVSGKTVPTVLVSGSGSVPEPPCKR